jgi:hypothetical protein
LCLSNKRLYQVMSYNYTNDWWTLHIH